MRPRSLRLLAIAVLALGLTVPAAAQGAGPAHLGQELGSVTVYVRSQQGEALSFTPQIKLTSMTYDAPVPNFPQSTGDGWVFSGVGAGDAYEVEVKVDGYDTAHETVTVPAFAGASASVIVFMKKTDDRLVFHPPTGQFVLAPRAQKEVEKGLRDLQSKKIVSGQRHLQKALSMSPANPYVNYAMGMSYLLTKDLTAARPYLEKSVSIDPKQASALLALGTLRFEQADYPGAIRMLTQTVQLDPSSWKAQWMLAGSYLYQKDFEHARKCSEKALALGKEKANQVELLLGEAQAGLGEREKALSAFRSFLNRYPTDPNAAKVHGWVVALEKPAQIATQPSGVALAPHPAEAVLPEPVLPPSPPVELPPRENWAPPDIDAEKPFVISDAACSLPKVLHAAGEHAVQLVSDLQKFTATEDYQSVEVKRNKQLETPDTRTYGYLVFLDAPRGHVIQVHEVRNQGMDAKDMPGRLADFGAPALALAFHPVYQGDFTWKCEGLGEWKDEPAWILRFEQRTDAPTSLLASFETPAQEFALSLKGRAWVSENGGEVMHLETDLTKPAAPVGLQREHFVIDYQPVQFRTHQVTLWLPERVDVYIQYQGHYLHHYHHYRNFKLFWTGSTEKIGKPKEAAQPQ
ncbi:MAG: tetratricopeptide repeat protein [Candidatus Acidiferrales bacterium]